MTERNESPLELETGAGNYTQTAVIESPVIVVSRA